jgi:hypothetical protein
MSIETCGEGGVGQEEAGYGQDRGSIFRNFMKKLNNLGPAKWDISNPKEEKFDYEVTNSTGLASTLQSFDFRASRGFQARNKAELRADTGVKEYQHFSAIREQDEYIPKEIGEDLNRNFDHLSKFKIN